MRLRYVIIVATTLCAGAAFLIVKSALTPPLPLRSAATTFELDDITIVNPAHDRLEHRNVRVGNSRIESIVETSKAKPGDQTYRKMFLLPGLIDMHAHMPPRTPLQLTSYFGLLDFAYGVTTIRNAGDTDGTALTAEMESAEKGYPGPRSPFCYSFISAGPSRWANTIALASAADADAAVLKLKDMGASCVKAYDGLTLPMVEALKRAADKYGLQLLGHVPLALRYEEALLPDVQHFMGIAELDLSRHFFLSDGWDAVDDAHLAAIVQVTKTHRLANTPTLVLGNQVLNLERYADVQQDPSAVLLPRLFRDVIWNPTAGLPVYRGLTKADFDKMRLAQEKKKRLVRMLYDVGATLHLGTDVQQPFVVPGYSLQQEMRLFVEAGVPTEQVWDMATRQAGIALGIADLGRIAEGAPADLLIFREDPTRDLKALDTLEAVISQGRLYPSAVIDAKVAEYRIHHEGWLFDRLSIVLAKLALRRAAPE